MKGLARLLPVFYIGLVLFGALLVFFEESQEQMLAWKKPTDSFRLPKIQRSATSDEPTSGGSMPDAPSKPDTAEPPLPAPTTTAGTTTVVQTRGEAKAEKQTQPPLKTILVWTFGYGSKTMGFGEGRGPFQSAGCEVDTCYLTGSRTMVPLPSFDAIIFHFRSLKPDDLPTARSPHQRWVFWEVESASYIYQDPSIYNGLFNWTMTYRLDSDIQQRYGRVTPIPPSPSTSPTPTPIPSPSLSPSPTLPPAGKDRNYAKGKTKMVAWFVSNCFTISRREKIVKVLKQFMQVDVYGKCGQFSCPRETTEECYNMLGQRYKFYLSFENSLCQDYVTEKLFSVLRHDVVPVVFGLANYTHIAPPHSFINVLDFSNLKDLIKYLKYLDRNDTAYNEYFTWKRHYRVEDGWENTAHSFCDLCKRLHEDQTPKVYKNIREWFVGMGHCRKLDARSWRSWSV